MRILYGIQGTGNGHTTRARVMAKAFSRMGVEVDYLFSGRDSNDYFDMGVFGDFRAFRGLTFASERGRVQPIKTIKQARIGHFLRDVRALNVGAYDLILNDFEPLSAWAGKRQGVPVIGMSHQAAFLSPAVPVAGDNVLTRTLIRYFAPADHHLGVHWSPFADNIIPPFIEDEELNEQGLSLDNKVLVYLPFEDLQEIRAYLRDFPDKEFYCYHPAAQDGSEQHIHLRAPSREGFLKDLSNASGIIANAGFELSSEALRFGKKLLLKPLAGQFEQVSNAITLRDMGLAHVMNYLDPNALEDWILSTSFEQIRFPNDPTPLVEWLLKKRWQDTASLNKALWQGIQHQSA